MNDTTYHLVRCALIAAREYLDGCDPKFHSDTHVIAKIDGALEAIGPVPESLKIDYGRPEPTMKGERMTARDLAGLLGLLIYDYLGDNKLFRLSEWQEKAAALIDADRREVERQCAEKAAAYLRGMGFVIDEDAETKLRAAITSPAKED